ncbi:peroxide stress protein YaaA [Marinigracilibium pacificum]|uniref:UPF0246 protein HH304_10600 n=1 Tax=Marinigracilibium pacificum TaxID=2729599 RepID=A0A848J2T3_9BACT|nr:peroxide stress protein YaaA [Marinigracilibium pacificum]NMM48850.1 peroxide stress protein YaaA [Marinigracilibium pacificum]
MILIISPSKTQDFSDSDFKIKSSIPEFLSESKKLVRELRKLSVTQLESLMAISTNLAELNAQRFEEFSVPFSEDNAKQALMAFKGDVYTGFDFGSYSESDFEFAQNHLRILSGLYGMLKPLDLIQPYRLEMKTKLENERGKDLYKFWGDRPTDKLNKEFKEHKSKVLINLASNEYFKVIDKKKLDAEIITPVFKEIKGGKAKVIAIFAKKARGTMADYIIKNKIQNPEELKLFTGMGYTFDNELSSKNEFVFTRES